MNKYRNAGEEDEIPTLKIEPEVERQQIERIKALRARRDEQTAQQALARVREAVRDEKLNVMPPIIEAVKVYVTLGEHRDPAYL